MIDSLRQVQVVSALARLAGNGAWDRMLEGRPLVTDLDLADARLLVAAGLLSRGPEGRLSPVDFHPWYGDSRVLARGLVAQLRRAVLHALDADQTSLDTEDLEIMGYASEAVAAVLVDEVLPMLAGIEERLVSGTAAFLDVGVGTGAIAERVCRTHAGATAVGLDTSAEALSAAKERLSGSPVGARIELREMSVADLPDVDAFDIAWMPQVFLTPPDLAVGVERVLTALRPGGWLVMPVAASPPDAGPVESASLELDAALRGGGLMSVAAATRLLHATGYTAVRDMQGVDQSLVMARRPPASVPRG